MKELAGKFIVFDGPDGCGKTTQRDRVAEALQSAHLDIVTCKDPGGTAIGDRIRHVLLDYDLSQMDVRCETMLFMASRAQLVGEVIDPALAAGKTVLCDRYVSSTCAYQVAAGYPMQRVLDVAPFAIGGTWPDLTLVFDVDAEIGLRRTGRKPGSARRKSSSGQHGMFADAVVDAMEARPLDFHRRVRQAFLKLSDAYPRPVRVVKGADRQPADIHREVMDILSGMFAAGA